jgi:hypothetical protein
MTKCAVSKLPPSATRPRLHARKLLIDQLALRQAALPRDHTDHAGYSVNMETEPAQKSAQSVLPLLSLFLMSGLLLTGCDSAPPAPAGPRPAVARICRDGSYIYRHADGTYWAWNGYRVDDIDKVCDR